MNSLIQELTTELKSNTQIKDSIVVKVVLESINNSVLLGVASSDVLENALSTLDQLAQATVNENLKEVVAKFKKWQLNLHRDFKIWQKRPVYH